MFRVGIGWDQHPLRPGRPLVLGGERIEHPRGLLGHSDGDALLHAVCDAILGALGEPDLGSLFPDRDPALRNADSLTFLREIVRRMRRSDWRIGNLDAVVLAQEPHLAPHLDSIRRRLAQELGCPPGDVSVKAKSPEGVGSLGKGEAIAVQAVALLVRPREPAVG